MIIATAGHVDHGKTLLVKALTGVDTDRLPEEKKRNLTIDLGFAYVPIEGHETLGFIDVPGHERFIRNALCGLAGTDFVLFIVAADDGPMPQTEEHLAIIDLLAVSQGAIALTKTDRVTPDRIQHVKQEIAALFAATTMQSAPVFPVSAQTGAGIAELRAHLIEMAKTLPPRPVRHNFRLAIDRTFDVVGAGFIVTGTVFSGGVNVGDRVSVLGGDMALRVRGIHAQNVSAASGRAGQRCALNLAGGDLDKSRIERGCWVADARVPRPIQKVDVDLRVLASTGQPLAHWTPVHVHLGAAEVTGRVAILADKRIEAGAQGLAQLVLDRPIGAVFSDGVIIRDQSARYTIGGGRVIDIHPPARGRSRPSRLAWLEAQNNDDDVAALSALLALAPTGVDLTQFAENRNLTAAEMAVVEAAVTMRVVVGDGIRLGFASDVWSGLVAATVRRLQDWHDRSPGSMGLADQQALAGTGHKVASHAAAAVIAAMVMDGALLRTEFGVRLPSHQARLDPVDAKLWSVVGPVLADAGLRPMSVREIAEATSIDWKRIDAFLVRAGRLRLVYRISNNRISTPAALQSLGEVAMRLAEESSDGLVSVAQFRDASGIGRNMSVELLEFFDKQRLTQRVGDRRKILQPIGKVLGTEQAV